MTTLTTIKARARLLARGKPYWVATASPGISLGYRKLTDRAGTWSARLADGKGGNQVKALGLADDLEPANGAEVLTYEQAEAKARKLNRAPALEGDLTVARVLEEYATANAERQPGNVARVRYWLGQVGRHLLTKDVQQLTARELKAWRDAITAAPATVNRTIRILKSALTAAVEARPEQEFNSEAWRIGLKQKPNSHESNNVVLSDDQVRDLVAAAYRVDPAFGLFTEVGAITGARPCQLELLEVRDLRGIEQGDGAPRLMMPTSKKGTGSKPRRIMVPITAALAGKLRSNRGPSEPLLLRSQGDAWSASSSDYARPFALAVEAAGVKDGQGRKVTYYALRHSSIVRRIKANKVPLRTIAAIHDTSVVMIERNYARDIDQYDDSARAGLLEVELPMAANVIPLAKPREAPAR
jgi:integrase